MVHPVQKSWTNKEIKLLAELRGIGYSYSEAGKVLGRSSGSVGHAVKRFAIKSKSRSRGPWTPENIEKLIRMWGEGDSCSVIAAKIGGVSRNAVIGKVHRLGLSGRATTSRVKPARARKHKAARTHNSPRLGLFNPKYVTLLYPQSEELQKEVFKTEYEELVIPVEERVQLIDLKENQCRWPIGDPKEKDFHFCGKKKCDGSPYCEYHTEIAYNVSPKKLPSTVPKINEGAQTA